MCVRIICKGYGGLDSEKRKAGGWVVGLRHDGSVPIRSKF